MAGIYIHIPFCKKLCNYCDFYHVQNVDNYGPFLEALNREAIIRKDYLENENVTSIYIGGGTPSVLQVSEVQLIFQNIREIFSIDMDCEITMELNPDDVNPDYLKGLFDLNINRISLGIQSWRNADLRLLNRRHDTFQAEQALYETFKAGFTNITIDLIYGIPGMTLNDWSENLDKSLSFDIKHLSAYHLTIEPETPFASMKERGLISEAEEEESSAQFNLLLEKATNAGFIHYEISNFGKPGFFSKHNSSYWKQVSYLGLGPSAHSFNGYSRQWNVRDVKKYIKSVNSGDLLFEKENLSKRIRFNEYILTSLRTMWGIDLDYVEATFDKEGYDYLVNLSGKLIDYGLMKQENKTLVLTNQGKMISDNIIRELMLPE